VIASGLNFNLARELRVTEALSAAALGLLGAILVGAILPILESAFDRTTDLSWLELTSLDHPILRRLSLEAPGTYLHSILVGHLAEPLVVGLGLVDLVETNHRICDEVCLVPTVGHTPGHCSVSIKSGGHEALITGDFVHHPCQMAMPAWAATVDYDSEQSTRTRREVFGRLANTSTLVIGTHFAGPTAGHIKTDGDAFRLEV
jgi:glyoxylase-like metal-dependent hydrolase (beta-lactamase superfamily II)